MYAATPNLQAGQEEEVRASVAVIGEVARAIPARGAAVSTDVGAAVHRPGDQHPKCECT